MADSLAADLRKHIYQAHADGPRKGSHWVMSLDWLNEVRKLHDNDGRVIWEPGLVSLGLLGIPVDVRDDGGLPHLEPDAEEAP